MTAYKLVSKRKDGSLHSLFINKGDSLPTKKWLQASPYPTKGYAYRPGWHCLLTPEAPHLSIKNRVWIKVKVKNYTLHTRPASQGGRWVLAQEMKILEEL